MAQKTDTSGEIARYMESIADYLILVFGVLMLAFFFFGVLVLGLKVYGLTGNISIDGILGLVNMALLIVLFAEFFETFTTRFFEDKILLHILSMGIIGVSLGIMEDWIPIRGEPMKSGLIAVLFASLMAAVLLGYHVKKD